MSVATGIDNGSTGKITTPPLLQLRMTWMVNVATDIFLIVRYEAYRVLI